jgi:hypothetical protein
MRLGQERLGWERLGRETFGEPEPDMSLDRVTFGEQDRETFGEQKIIAGWGVL